MFRMPPAPQARPDPYPDPDPSPKATPDPDPDPDPDPTSRSRFRAEGAPSPSPSLSPSPPSEPKWLGPRREFRSTVANFFMVPREDGVYIERMPSAPGRDDGEYVIVPYEMLSDILAEGCRIYDARQDERIARLQAPK